MSEQKGGRSREVEAGAYWYLEPGATYALPRPPLNGPRWRNEEEAYITGMREGRRKIRASMLKWWSELPLWRRLIIAWRGYL